MSLKNRIQQIISKNSKNKNRAKKLAAMKKQSNQNSNKSSSTSKANSFWVERLPLFAALFFFAFGMGLISDGKKMYAHQLKLSQRVDYKATLNPN